jgi:multidrug efflux pump subunit AcrB
MKITEFSVKNHQFTIIIFIMIMALGISSLINMPKAEDPVLKATFNSIIVVYPGTSPEDIEKLIIEPIEEKMSGIADIKKMISTANDGVASVIIEFNHYVDEGEKYNEVLRELNALRSKLPQDVFSIDVLKYTPETVNILQAALLSETASFKQLNDLAEDLKKDLLKIKDLKEVQIWAAPKQQVQISINAEKMAQYNIPVNRIISILQSENLNIPAGSIEIGERKINVKTSGSFKSIEDIKKTVLSSSGVQITYLSDIAEVNIVYEEDAYLARLNGKRGIFITASQKKNTNIFFINEKISPILNSFSKNLPSNVKFEQSFDQAKSVSKRLFGLARDFGIAIVLVLFTLIPLGIRAAFIVMISIPLSLAIGLAGLDILGFGINQLSVVGLVISLGLLVDDSIVVVENIARFLRNGYSRKDAAILATKQISLAVLGCTATLIFAFLPLTFLPESSGDFIRSLPMAVITTVLASLFVSLTIVPFLASMIMPKEENEKGNKVLQIMTKVIEGSYRKILSFSLKNPFVTLAGAFLIFLGSLALIPIIGISVFPKSEKPQFLINVEMPLGTSLSETDKAIRYVENVISKDSIVKNFASNVGKDNPRIYYNILPKAGTATNYGQIFVQLQDEVEVPERTSYIEKLRKSFSKYPGTKIKVIEFEQGAPVEAPLALRIIGDNLDSLRKIASNVEKLYKDTEGTIYINNPMSAVNTDLRVNINKDKAGMMGIPIAEIDKAIRMAVSGLSVGTLQTKNAEDFEMLVTVPKENQKSLEIFNKVFLTTATGSQVPLNQLADIQFETSPTRIQHYDQERYTSVSAFVAEGYLTPDVQKKFKDKLSSLDLPEGYQIKMAGAEEQQAEAFGGLGKIIIITIFGILAILVLEFKTFKSSFIVLSVIPLGVIGAVGILFLTGNSLSFTAIVGIIALAGIEVKNSILLVDYTNYLRKEENMEIDAAIEKAGETRFIPIVLTTLTAIGGLIPLVLEHSPLYSPLALVIIGGLVSSLVLTRIVTPVMYKLLPPKI